MFPDTQSQTEQEQWSKKDKAVMLKLQIGVSVLSIFFSIILATNLFLLEDQQSSMITYNLAWAAVVVAVFSIASLYWAFTSGKKLAGDNSTDNIYSRVILFVAILLSVQFFIYYVVYEYASGNLIWYVQAHFNKTETQKYVNDVDQKSGWVEFLSISLIFFLFFSVFSAFALTGSQITSRLQVYLVGLVLTVTCFQELFNRRIINATYENSNAKLEYPSNLSFILAIVTIVILIFTFLANAKRLRLAYLLIGTFYLVTTALQITATGAFFKNYQNQGLDLANPTTCNNVLSNVDAKYIEAKGCPQKYEYRHTPTITCPYAADPQACFQSVQQCATGNSPAAVWETYLKPENDQAFVFGCVNTSKCCGIVKSLFSEPLLRQAIYSMQYCLYTFILASFCYQLSSQSKGQQKINEKVQIILLFSFVVFLVCGGFYLSLNIEVIKTKDGFKRSINEQISVSKQTLSLEDSEMVMTITQDSSLKGYAAESGCQKIEDLFSNKGATFTNALLTNPESQAINSLGDLEALLHYDELPANNQCYAADGQVVLCNQPGYLVVLQAPPKSGKCSETPRFVYHDSRDNTQKHDGIQLISPTTALSLLEQKVSANAQTRDTESIASLTKQSVFSFIGNNKHVLEELGKLTVCHLQDCDYTQLHFLIRVIKVDLDHFEFYDNHDNKNEENIAYNNEEDIEIHDFKKSLRHSAAKGPAKTPAKTPAKKSPTPAPASKKSPAPAPAAKKQPAKAPAAPKQQAPKAPKQAAPKTAAAGPVDTSEFNIWGNQNFRVQVYDLIEGNHVEEANVLIYRVDNNKQYDGLCQEYLNFQYQPELNATTTHQGQAGLKVLYGPDIAKNKEEALSEKAIQNYVTYYIHVTAEGFHGNCRQVSFGYGTLDSYSPVFRIGLHSYLSSLQSRAVLEWDNQFVQDLYIWTAFSDEGLFDCEVGPYNQQCQSVYYDQPSRKDPASSITFNKIGQYNYLVYFNRLEQGIIDDETNGRVTDFASKIASAGQNGKSINPIIKYYTGEAEFPEYVTSKDLIQQADMQKLDAVETKKNGKKVAHTDFAILEFCLLVKETHSLKPVSFDKSNYLWSVNKGFGEYDEKVSHEIFPEATDKTDSNVGICEQLQKTVSKK